MSEKARTETHHKVYVLVAIDVPHPRRVRLGGVNRIDHFFPEPVKSGRGAWICQCRSILFGQFLGAGGTLDVASYEFLQILLLLRRNRSMRILVKRLEWTMRFSSRRFCSDGRRFRYR